jgi:hypothetical protein
MSRADQKKGLKGSRSFHWAKDLAVDPREFDFDPKIQAGILVDVDEYLDMPNLLARYPGVYFVSTFQPTTAAENVGEYQFRFHEEQFCEYRVSGGAKYEAMIWNYKGDTFVVEDVGLLRKKVVAYHIDRKHIDSHHALIMLSPIAAFEMPSIVPTCFVIEGATLDRLRPVFGNNVVMDVIRPSGLHRSVSILGDWNAVTLPVHQWDAVHAVAMVAKVPITPSMVASNIAPSDPSGLPTERLPPGHAAIIAGYTRAGVPLFPPEVYPPEESCIPIWFSKHDYDAPVPLAGFGAPLIGPNYSFASSISTDNVCIKGRVEAFHDQVAGPIPPSLAGYMFEFLERVIPIPHIGHPVGHDEVREKQSRPSQRAILEEASVTGELYKRAWSTFTKKEPAQKVTDPRNISQSPPATKLGYATYTYAFHDGVMCEQAWYAFAKTPAEIADRVVLLLAPAKIAVLSDASRMDGHIKRYLRLLERLAMLRYFARQYHGHLNQMMDEQIALPATTEFGRRYFSGYGRGSGSAETADFNSLDTAFMAYCAHRNTTVNGKKKTPEEAFQALGIYGGDDAMDADVDPEALVKSAQLCGQKYDVEVVRRGEIGVNFLNRWFGPDVWNGDVNSMANPARLLSKLWIGPKMLRQPLIRFAERCSGYYRMDRNSPVIGDIVSVAHALLGEYTEGALMPWDGKHGLDTNWPNEKREWMWDIFEQSIPDFDENRFRTWIRGVAESGDARELLRAPLCTAAQSVPLVTKVAAVVGDEVVLPVPGQEAAVAPPDDKGKEELVIEVAEKAELIPVPVVDTPVAFEFQAPPLQDTAVVLRGWQVPLGSFDFGAETVSESQDAVPRTPPTPKREVATYLTGQAFKESPEFAKFLERAGALGPMGQETEQSRALAAAEAAVPQVGSDGKRIRKQKPVEKVSAVASAAKTERTEPVTCTHSSWSLKKKDGEPMPCVCTWTPKAKRTETDEEYAVYLKKWNSSRAALAKRGGVKLT